MANITTEYGTQDTFKVERLQSKTTFTPGPAVFLATLNVILSITASLGNALILYVIALPQVTSIHPPTKLLFRCLAVSDLCVGLVSEPLFCIGLISKAVEVNKTLLHYSNLLNSATSVALCGVSILTSTTISVDRLLALLLGLRYRHVVTLRRIRTVIICFCLLSCALGGWKYSFWAKETIQTVFFVMLLLCLLASVISYTKIYFILRHHQIQLQPHAHQGQPPNGGETPLNIARYKKTVSSIAWVQILLLICYLPFSSVGMVIMYAKLLSPSASQYEMYYFLHRSALSLLYLNSSLNPILYCWKIREVRQAVKDTIKQINCCSSTWA